MTSTKKERQPSIYNWYRPGSALGRFKAITNPTVGNHEYENGSAPGYFDYWGANTPHFYSVNAGGWHIISLDSTSEFNQTAAGIRSIQLARQRPQHQHGSLYHRLLPPPRLQRRSGGGRTGVPDGHGRHVVAARPARR